MATAVHLTHALTDDEQIHVTVETDAAYSPDVATDLGNRARELLRQVTADSIATFRAAKEFGRR